MEKDYPVSLLMKMLELYSPSGQESNISEFLASEMKRLGFEVARDEVGNVEGRLGQGSPKFLLCGHMDTVEGKLEVRRRGKVIFGRGAVDAKSPLAAMICAAIGAHSAGLNGSITVLAVVDEEGKSRGMKHFLSHTRDRYDYAIFGEPSGAYAVTVGYKGRLVLKVLLRTSPGHASAPQLFENAVYVASDLVSELRSLNAKWGEGADQSDLFQSPTLSVTGIKGGMQDNTIPSECELVTDIRVPPSKTLEGIKDELIEAVGRVASKNPKAEVDSRFADENEPFLEKPDSALAKAFVESIKEIKGREGRLSRKTGTGDINDFVKKFPISAVVYGPGNSKLDHTPLENISVEELLDSIRIIGSVLRKLSSKRTSSCSC